MERSCSAGIVRILSRIVSDVVGEILEQSRTIRTVNIDDSKCRLGAQVSLSSGTGSSNLTPSDCVAVDSGAKQREGRVMLQKAGRAI